MNELPASRLPIKNCVVGQKARPAAWEFIRKQTALGRQAYVICPMIEESETLDVENVTAYAGMLAQAMPPSVRVEALNGKMSPAEKNEIMDRFSRGDFRSSWSTTVVEVGIDVPNATVMLIEMRNGSVWHSFISFVAGSVAAGNSLTAFSFPVLNRKRRWRDCQSWEGRMMVFISQTRI